MKRNVKIFGEMSGGGRALFSNGTSTSRGVCILFRKNLFININKIYSDPGGRYILCELSQDDDIKITLACIYAPNGDNPEFFVQLEAKLEQYSEHTVVIGDFNVPLKPEIDRHSTNRVNKQATTTILEIMQRQKLVDIWRVRNPGVRKYTWSRKNQASRLDYALVSQGLDQKILECMYLHGIRSDHDAMYLLLQLSKNQRGAGYWKMNVAHLNNKQFVESTKNELIRILDTTQHFQPIKRWEYLKVKIKKFLQQKTKSIASESKLIIAELREKLTDMSAMRPFSEQMDTIYRNTELDLQELLDERVQSLIFRSQVRWYEGGERSTKYFFNLEKRNYNAKTCSKLLLENGSIIEDDPLILAEQRKFYETLYSKDPAVSFKLENTTEICLSESDRDTCNLPITEHEVSKAILSMSNGKVPGYDGLPIEFYKVFWKQLKVLFHEVIQEVYIGESLNMSAKKGILNLIPKANKDMRVLKNLRPITLLNTDYKIMEKCIAERMSKVLPSIIHHDQTGFMKGRRIAVNIQKLFDLITYCNDHQIQALFLSLDFMKCFDMIDFSAIEGSLRYFNFPDYIIRWVNILYSGFTVQVQNNGHFSDIINVQRSVHQGGCCSSYLFLCCAEILAINIRNNKEI